MANNYALGSVVRLSTAFTSSSVATDPTTVQIKVKSQTSLNIYVYGASSVVKDSTGAYHLDVTVGTPGDWYYRWEGTGTVIAGAEGHFTVGPTYFP